MREIFRAEALAEAERKRSSTEGQVLNLTPFWLELAFASVVIMAVASLIFVTVARVGDYAVGPGLVRSRSQVSVSARLSGVVSDVLVAPGQTVKKGQVLLGFERSNLLAQLQRLDSEIRNQILRTLTKPDDVSATAALATLYAQRDESQARLDNLLVTSPVDGRVTEVPVLPGQTRDLGDVVVRLDREGGTFYLVAAEQGELRPLLQLGQSINVEFVGYPNLIYPLKLDRLSDAVVGPDEVRRHLGRANSDTFSLEGPRVLIEADFPEPGFSHQGRWVPLVDGLTAKVSVKVRSQRFIVALVPMLRELLDDG
ncbi:MAG: biotin/lipoyl-binding protein [Archangiaceae bacterium]|nr:biotin/lipoyl-binding protein [Archangiaceae bacterium]